MSEERQAQAAQPTTPETVMSGKQPLRKRPSWESLSVLLAILVLLLGAYMRFSGLDWDGNHHLHPDERFLTIVTTQIEPVSDPLTYLRTSKSSLNPYNAGQGFFVYGNFPMTVTRYLAQWANDVCQTLIGAEAATGLCSLNFTEYDGVHLFGRFLSGLVDLISVLFIFLIGRRLYNWQAGLLGALLLALAVMPIQQSHFYTMDNWAAALTTVALYTAVRAAGLGSDEAQSPLHWWALFGLFLGLATASRINVAPLAGMAPVAGVVWLARRGHSPAAWTRLRDWSPRQMDDFQRVVVGVALAAAVSLLTFRLAQPYAFADAAIAREEVREQTGQEPGPLSVALRAAVGLNPQWRSNIEEIQRLQQPDASFPPALQWTDRTPILFPWTNMVLYGMGLTAGLMAWIGFFWALWRIARFRPDWTAHAIPVVWSGFYFLFMSTRWVKSIRYFLPVYPTLLLLAGWALVTLWQRSTRAQRYAAGKRIAAVALILLTIIPTFLWANAFIQIYRQPVTRVAASHWMFANVPSGATLLYEADGETQKLQLPLKGYEFTSQGFPLTLNFMLPQDGTITAVRFNYLTPLAPDETDAADGHSLTVTLNGETAVSAPLDLEPEARHAATVDLPDTAVPADAPQTLVAELGSDSPPIRAGTSMLANEHWDDLLPVALGNRNPYASYYSEVSGGQRPVTHPDDPEKREQVIAWLDEADYVVLSSQRAVWHLPRLPLTYPLMIRYYDALFSGELGFELVHQEHATHRIGPMYISDTTGQIGWGQPPDVGWPPPGELAAEEAFSVYDHPPVWIFAKTEAYSHENAIRLLGAVDLSQTTRMTPGEATLAPNGLMLTEMEQTIQEENGTFNRLFNPDGLLNQNPALAAVIWWLAVIGLGWLAFPLCFAVLGGLPDKGYSLARILALLIISYFGWLMASLGWLSHNRGALLLGVVLVAVLSLAVGWRRRREMAVFLRHNLAYVGVVELVGVLLFLLMIGIRLGNPDVWDVIWGGEKPMDLSYFTAVLKSTTFPPYDPWFAGGYINYYYYGFVFVGALTKLLGVLPTIAYNLILPMLFSFTGLGAFGVAYNLVKAQKIKDLRAKSTGSALINNLKSLHRPAIVAGLIAMTLAVLLGNLAQVGVLFSSWRQAGDAALGSLPLVGPLVQTLDGGLKIIGGQPSPLYTGDWFWLASRAINANPGEVQPITEFPFFTFLYGDLHAHMISLPLQMLALGWVVSLVLRINDLRLKSREQQTRPQTSILNLQSSIFEVALLWLTGGIAIGVLRATNTWDWPTYLVLGGLAVVYAAYRQHGRFSLPMIGQAVVQTAVLVGLSILTFWPFIANYGVGYTSFKLWPGSYTQVGNYLVVYGLFLLFVFTHLGREFRAWSRTWTYENLRRLQPVARLLIAAGMLYVILLLLLLVRGYLIAPIVLTLIVVSGLLGLRPNLPPARRIVLILIASALGLTLLVEIVVLDGDIGRMNTVFKFYMQVWLLLSVVGGVTAVWAWPAIRTKSVTRKVWQGALTLLVFAAALYPLLATRAKWQVRMSQDAPHILDGMAFMPHTEYSDTNYDGNSRVIQLADEYAALRWLQRNVAGSPVVAEAAPPSVGEAYRSIGSRVAIYTGLPTILGWDWHQQQQRAVLPNTLIKDRMNDVKTLFNTTDQIQALSLLNQYDVRYIYLGSQERLYYRPEGLEKFDDMVAAGYLEEVYRNAGINIYKVISYQPAAISATTDN